MLELQNVGLTLQARRILNNVSFEVERRSIHVVLGQNGAGKSSLLKLILGIYECQEGKILFDKQQLTSATRTSYLRKMGALIENASLYSHLTAFQNLELLRRIYKTEKTYSDELLSLVGLLHKRDEKVRYFSLGMKQRLGLAMAMIGKPELIVLDEPTNGLDPDGVSDLKKLILKFNNDMDTTFLLSSHHLHEAEQIATHVTIMQGGTAKLSTKLEGERKGKLEELYFNIASNY